MSELKEFLLPDIGADAADITDILVSVGDTISEDQDILSIEGDKAAMDVPSSITGIVKEIKVAVGDSVSEGNVVLIVEVAGETAPAGRTMGHAGAIVGGSDDTAQAKKEIMRACGIHVVDSPAEIGLKVKEVMS